MGPAMKYPLSLLPNLIIYWLVSSYEGVANMIGNNDSVGKYLMLGTCPQHTHTHITTPIRISFSDKNLGWKHDK